MLALQKQYFFPVKNLNDLNTVPWSASYVGHAKQEISKWMNDDVLKFTKQDLKVWGWLRHRLAPSLCRAGGGTWSLIGMCVNINILMLFWFLLKTILISPITKYVILKFFIWGFIFLILELIDYLRVEKYLHTEVEF